ncbi:hypothetical protein FSP39_024690 [Pinctada imbricata]|uniref:Adenosine deaminase n=1 Tax=Pinctada imbricata TaxID=66713 RepID=A0AA88XK64_PINIB|nr:hypothetical protein FSP39_024690 [Pinctada imbricata]
MIFSCHGTPSYRAEESYARQRTSLEKEELSYAGYDTSLSHDERIVNSYLEYLKIKEFDRTRNDFPPARPITKHLAEIQNTDVYRVLKRLPKGGNLHLHHNHVVSKSILWDIVQELNLFDHLYIQPQTWRLDLKLNPPNGFIRTTDNSTYYTKARILKNSVFTSLINETLLNRPTDSELRWKAMSPLFGRMGSRLINHANVSVRYMEAMLQAAVEENVQYLETKASSYRKLYVLDPSPDYFSHGGKRYIDNEDGEIELQLVDQVVEKFTKKNPSFIGYKRVINSGRRYTKFFQSDLERAYRLFKKYPHLVAGYDLVGEEDRGYSLLFFMKDFAKLQDNGTTIPFFFHTAETNWPDDLITSIRSDDPFSAMQNVYEAVILGAKRVGHGIGFLHHPYLMKQLKKRQIAVEANPVSNKMLGYVPDQRHHPAITYLRMGIPVVLGADDPGTFGYDNFTVDWYEAFMGWGINLADLRQLANNSLAFSSLDDTKKRLALTKWKILWQEYIRDMKSEACAMNVIEDPLIESIYPSEVTHVQETTIRVFGRRFQRAVCNVVICSFGSAQSIGTYVYNSLITCPLPNLNSSPTALRDEQFKFSISFDGGKSFISTSMNLTYHKTPIQNGIPPQAFG